MLTPTVSTASSRVSVSSSGGSESRRPDVRSSVGTLSRTRPVLDALGLEGAEA